MVVANSEKMLKESDETDTKQNKQKTKSKGKKNNFWFEGETTIEIYARSSTDSSCHIFELLHRFLMSFLRGTPQIPHVIFARYSTDSSCHFDLVKAWLQ
jgi:hypothetical protein